jgi:integrase
LGAGYKAAGLQGLRIHDPRHTAVARWIAAGATPKEVAVRAGPTSVCFTLDRYGHQTIPGRLRGRCHPVRD